MSHCVTYFRFSLCAWWGGKDAFLVIGVRVVKKQTRISSVYRNILSTSAKIFGLQILYSQRLLVQCICCECAYSFKHSILIVSVRLLSLFIRILRFCHTGFCYFFFLVSVIEWKFCAQNHCDQCFFNWFVFSFLFVSRDALILIFFCSSWYAYLFKSSDLVVTNFFSMVSFHYAVFSELQLHFIPFLSVFCH